MLPGASIPSDLPEDVPLPNMLKEALRSNLSFQADVRLFQEDLAAGRYERKWLADAQSSIDKRAAGKFDSWKEKNREEFWGQKQKIAAGALAGESSQHTLPTLVEGQCFMVGDVWRLNRSRMQEKPLKKIVVEKEARVSYLIRPLYQPVLMRADHEHIRRQPLVLLLPTRSACHLVSRKWQRRTSLRR